MLERLVNGAEPEVFRVDAEVNHAEGGAHVHERLLEALASSRQRDAKLWELKTATSLAGWYQRNDDTVQARATLTVVEALSNQNELVPLARAQPPRRALTLTLMRTHDYPASISGRK